MNFTDNEINKTKIIDPYNWDWDGFLRFLKNDYQKVDHDYC